MSLDWTGIEDTFLSAQLFQSWAVDSPYGLVRDELDINLTFLARRDCLNDTLQAEVLWIVNTNDGDGLIRPKLTYKWQDNVKTWVGVDIFYGIVMACLASSETMIRSSSEWNWDINISNSAGQPVQVLHLR
jgi:hypothetical protein